MATNAITTKVANGTRYLETIYRGTEYTLRQTNYGWELSTRRIGYGDRFHIGGCKHFASIAELVAGCKAFGDAANVIALAYGVDVAAVGAA